MTAKRDDVRVGAVLLAALLGVHQLRYLLAFGGEAGNALARHGHGYMAWVTPAVAALGTLAVARLLVRAAGGTGPGGTMSHRITRLWPAAAAALFGLYTAQELLEGWLAQGHPASWAGVFGGGGWIALPLAVAFGAVIAAVLRLTEALEARLRNGRTAPIRTIATPAPGHPLLDTPSSDTLSAGVLAHHLAGRAPPRRRSTA